MAMYFYNRESELYHMMNDDDYLCHYGIPGMKWGKRKLKEIKNWYEERKKYRIRNKRFKSINKTANQWAKNDKKVAKVERRVANRSTGPIAELISPDKVSQTKNFNSSVMANRKAYEKALEEQKRQKEYRAKKWRTDLRKVKNANAIKNESAAIQKYVDWDVEYYKKTGKKRPYKK